MNSLSRGVAIVAALAAGLAACGDDRDATKAGSASEPVTLRIGTADTPGRPSELQIVEFSRRVEELSEGTMTIEAVWRAGGEESGDWDQEVGRLVVGGELEMGLIPARAWDTEGVTSLRALHAPFLVTSDELINEVVTSDLADGMLAGLDAIDLTGLALLPEGLRHIFVFGDADGSLLDLDGKVVRAPMSVTAYALYRELGAKPDDHNSDAFASGVQAGTIYAAESSFTLTGTLPALSSAYANLTLFPKVNSLVVNTKAFDELSDDQQRVLRDAAAQTLEWAVAEMPSDGDGAKAFCAAGGRIVNAADSDVAAIMEAARPVYAELERDDTTKALIDRIRAIREELPAPPAIPTCEPSQPTETTEAAGEEALALDGVWRQDVSYEYLVEAGLSEWKAREESGVATYTLDGGEFRLQYQHNDCRGTYEVVGDRVTFRWISGCSGDHAMTASLDGNQIVWSDAEPLPPHNTPEDQVIVDAFAGVAWTRIGDPPSAEPDFPEGTYRAELPVELVLDAGVERPTALDHAGVWTLTFADGAVTIEEVNAATGETRRGSGVYCVADGRVSVGLQDAPEVGTDCGDFWSAGWTFDGDELQFTQVRSGHGSDLLIEALFGSTPFTKID